MKKWFIEKKENFDKWFSGIAVRLLFLTLGIYVSDYKIIVGAINVICIVFLVIAIVCWIMYTFIGYPDASKGK